MNAQDKKLFAPLHTLAQAEKVEAQHIQIAQYLLANKADPSPQDRNLRVPLFIFISHYENYKLIALLPKKTTDPLTPHNITQIGRDTPSLQCRNQCQRSKMGNSSYMFLFDKEAGSFPASN